MALLFYSQDDDAEAWRRQLLERLPDLEYRVWPDVGDPAEVRFLRAGRPRQSACQE